MSFPTTPTNNQITTVNGIRYQYNTANNSWVKLSNAKFTAAASGPSNPAPGDQWYNTSEDILYEWISDGVSSYWIDIQSGLVTGNASGVISDTTIAGNLTVTGNATIAGNVTFSSTVLPVVSGGTGANTAAQARTNLGVDPAGTAVALSIALG